MLVLTGRAFRVALSVLALLGSACSSSHSEPGATGGVSGSVPAADQGGEAGDSATSGGAGESGNESGGANARGGAAGTHAGAAGTHAGGSAGTSEAEGGASDDSFAAIRGTLCRPLRDCCAVEGFNHEGLADCEQYFGQAHDVEDAIASGAVTVDDSAVAACQAAVAARFMVCADFPRADINDQFFDGLPACQKAFTGTIALGEPCKMTLERAVSNTKRVRCLNKGDTSVCQDIPIGKVGELCLGTEGPNLLSVLEDQTDVGNVVCRRQDGLFCAYGANAKCAPVYADGVGCANDEDVCSAQSYCDVKCKPRQGLGQSCKTSRECLSSFCNGHECVEHFDVPQSTCEQVGLLP